MRNIKDILRGDFPGEDKKIIEMKCLNCGYVRRSGIKCPYCGHAKSEAIK